MPYRSAICSSRSFSSPKILAKISVKISAKFGAKALAGFVPFLGAAVSIGISLYILDEFLTSAKLYYEHKVKDTDSL